jgi:hypothetical protein
MVSFYSGIQIQATGYREHRESRRIIDGANSGTIEWMASLKNILDAMRRSPQNIRFADLLKVCIEHFGEPRQRGSSHAVFKTRWTGDPRVNIQNEKGKAKAYQVRQVLLAIDKLKGGEDETAENEPQE